MGKRRRQTSSSSSDSSSSEDSCNPNLHFGILLSAISNIQLPSQLNQIILKTTLHHFHLSQQTQIIPLISLLPILINSKCAEVACCGLEIVGEVSLFSFEMNELIALDDEVVKGLVNGVGRSTRSVSVAACNALLDLFTTSVGRCRLLEFSAVDKLIQGFKSFTYGLVGSANVVSLMGKLVPKSSTPRVSLVKEEKDNTTFFRIGFMEDEYPILLLHLAITLINECSFEQLEKVPDELAKKISTYLSTLWAEVQKQILTETPHELEGYFYLSNIRTNNLAESLFRLSMVSTFLTPSKFQEVEKSIFHLGQNSFESFIMNQWEQSPLLIKRPSNDSLHDNIFVSFSQFLNSKETVSSFLSFLLQHVTSALPISSDELDIINFLKESRENIGCPIIYQQDIRVVKTLDDKKERHFFEPYDVPYFLTSHDILRCEEAYKDGYTFALRGMEFRFKDIAAISEGLSFHFGQPSTGVNMYLTPPNSQGLARHRDDHCVLVCQIRGAKLWKIFPNPCPRLPRLYECVNDLLYLDGESEIIDGCKEFLLREGDILYIPRGFPHEACTIIDDDETNGNVDFSLHLTLAIEIEPPFEWEGFLHVAIHHWGRNYSLSNCKSSEDSSPDLIHDAAVDMMHIAVKMIGDFDPTCRKACLVGAISCPSVTEDFLRTHQKSTFNHLLSKINSDSNFIDVFSNIEVSNRKSEDLFEKLRWICHLDQNLSSMGMRDLFHLLVDQKDEVEAAFVEIKSKVCNEVVFDDIVHHYSVLLEKYKTARKQYINGMLSLNCI